MADGSAATGTAPVRVGVIGDLGDAAEGLSAARFETLALDPVDAETVRSTAVDTWCVVADGLAPDVLRAVQDHGAPALFLAPADQAARWGRVLSRGVHDVAWTPVDPVELAARVRGLDARRVAWTDLTSMLCREIAHDLRGPMQALNFLVQAMSRGSEEDQGDVDMLRTVVDTFDVMVSAVSNLGHHPTRHWAPQGEDQAKVEPGDMLRDLAGGRFFRGKVDVSVGESLAVMARPRQLRRALLDTLRLVYQRMPSSGRIAVGGMSFGDEVVLTFEAPSYPAFLEHLRHMTRRDAPVLLRRERKPVVFAGLAFASEVFRAEGGSMTVRRQDDQLQVEARLPAL